MASSKLMMVVAVIAIASFCMPSTVAQTRHIVGDTFGWNVPSDGTATYTNWASRQTFNVGDTLLFNFTTGFHDVAEVSQAAFGPCTTASPISNNATGPTTLTLRTAGNHYYICTFGTHCNLGQKLMISVRGSSTTPTPTGSTTPAPAGSMTPPPPASSSSSFTAVVPVTFLAAALAFFY
ncbi:putative Blue (type 1) copper binding protein [Helianthus debilis subsp. tardiflorus]